MGQGSMSFMQSAGFQFLNPKGWVLAAATVSVDAAGAAPLPLFMVVLIFGAAAIASVLFWAALGARICAWATTAQRLTWLNLCTAALLVLTAAWMLVAG